MGSGKSGVYRQLNHTADIGIEVWGADLGELFSHAAFALFDMAADVEGVRPTVTTPIEVEADDLEMLMVNWLNDLIYRISAHEILYARATPHDKLPGADVRGTDQHRGC